MATMTGPRGRVLGIGRDCNVEECACQWAPIQFCGAILMECTLPGAAVTAIFAHLSFASFWSRPSRYSAMDLPSVGLRAEARRMAARGSILLESSRGIKRIGRMGELT
jgi:hypothetical protein